MNVIDFTVKSYVERDGKLRECPQQQFITCESVEQMREILKFHPPAEPTLFVATLTGNRSPG